MFTAHPLFNPVYVGRGGVVPPWSPETPAADLLQYWNDIKDPSIANPAVLNYRPVLQYNGSSAGSLRPYQPGRCYLGDGSAAITITGTVVSNSGSIQDNLVGQSGTIVIPAGEYVYDIKTDSGEHYKCDESDEDTAYDSSGQGNHGTIVNNYPGFHSTQNEYSFQNEVGFTN